MNHKKMKKNNRERIKKFLLESNSLVSRSDLIKDLKLGAGTVSALVNELITDGVIIEQSPQNNETSTAVSSGRKRVALLLNPDTQFYIGIELKKYNIVAALVDTARTVRKKIIYKIQRDTPETKYHEKILEIIQELLQEVTVPENITGIGLAVPGLVSHEAGKVINSFRVFNWKNFPLAKFLEKKIGLPVKVDSTVRCQCLAESLLGRIKGVNKAVFINIERGVEAAFILNGTLISDELFGAGFGHTTFDLGNQYEKRECICGNYNCLQSFIATYIVIEEAQNLLKAGHLSLILDQAGGEISKVTFRGIATAGRSGDKLALKLLNKYNYCLGKSLSNLVNLINPETVILGGDINMVLDLTMPFIERIVKSDAIAGMTQNIKFSGSEFPEYGAALGAALQLEVL
jgi:N-acetylglucosamine repressor